MAITQREIRTLTNFLLDAREAFGWALARLDELREKSDTSARFQCETSQATLEAVVQVLLKIAPYADQRSEELADRWLEQCHERYGFRPGWSEDTSLVPGEFRAAMTTSGAITIARAAAEAAVKRFAMGSSRASGAKELLRAWRTRDPERGLAFEFRRAHAFLEHAADESVATENLTPHLISRALGHLGRAAAGPGEQATNPEPRHDGQDLSWSERERILLAKAYPVAPLAGLIYRGKIGDNDDAEPSQAETDPRAAEKPDDECWTVRYSIECSIDLPEEEPAREVSLPVADGDAEQGSLDTGDPPEGGDAGEEAAVPNATSKKSELKRSLVAAALLEHHGFDDEKGALDLTFDPIAVRALERKANNRIDSSVGGEDLMVNRNHASDLFKMHFAGGHAGYQKLLNQNPERLLHILREIDQEWVSGRGLGAR